MASPFDVTIGEGFPFAGGNCMFLLDGELDTTAQPLAQNEIAEVIKVPANTFAAKVFYKVASGEGSASNIEVGDGSDADGFVATTDVQTAGGWVAAPLALTEGTPNTITGYSNGKLYTTADTIDIKSTSAAGLSKAKIQLKVLCVRL